MSAAGAGDGEGGGGGDDRRLRSLQGLLNFCVENTTSEDAPAAASSLTEMNPERRAFLEDVMKSLSENDPIKMMLQDIHCITNGKTTSEEMYAALENLQDNCEDLDLAQDFHKIGGFEMVMGLLSHEDSGVQWRAAELLGTLVQNNDYCQDVAIQAGFLPRLLTLLDTHSDLTVKAKALYAISCLTRDVAVGQAEFVSNDGFSVVLRAMQTSDSRLQTKAAFMTRAMCASNPALKDMLCDIGIVEQLVGMLHGEHSSSHEHLMGALLSQVEGHARSLQECRRQDLQLAQLLRDKVTTLKGKPQFEEEFGHSNTLLKLVFGENSTGNIDR